MISAEKSVYISYSWKKEKRKKTVEKIMAAFSAVGVEVKRDEKEIGYGDPIRAYMDELAAGGAIILVLSEPYIKSHNCMYELLEIYNHDRKKFRERIFPVVLKGTRFHNATDRLPYIQFWEEETKRLKAYFGSVDMTNIGTGSHQELRKYVEVSNKIDDLLSLIGDMNHLKEEDHLKDNFSALIKRIFPILPPSGGGGTDKTGHEKAAGNQSVDIDQNIVGNGNISSASGNITIGNVTIYADGTAPQPEKTDSPVSSAKPGTLFNVPDPPPNYFARPDDLKEFRAALLAEGTQTVGITGKRQHVGVQGMGGLGKSVLAAALAHDEDVRAAFPDGIFWLRFRQDADNAYLLEQQAEILKILAPDQLPDTLAYGENLLNLALQDKRCLFIADDLWDSKYLRHFNVRSSGCRFLLTTRNAEVIKKTGAHRCELGLLSDPQAREFLALSSGCAKNALPDEAAAILRECGRLPLAVAAIGSMVKGKPAQRWQIALEKFQNARLDKIPANLTDDYNYQSLFKVFAVSVEDLPPEVQAYYKTLVIFPEDAKIPESVLQLYWEHYQQGDYEPLDAVDLLVERSLLSRGAGEFVTLHDLLRDYLTHQSGGDVANLHKQLLEAYKAEYPGGWHTIPVEAPYYFHKYWHVHSQAVGDMIQDSVIADALIRQQSLLNMTGLRIALKFVDYQFDYVVFHLLKTNKHPDVLSTCLSILGDEAKEDARRLLKESNDAGLLCTCLSILGWEAKEDARRLLKENNDKEVLCTSLNILGVKAKEDARRFLREDQHPDVLSTCLSILGDEAKEDARRLLKERDEASILSSCLSILGNEAKEDARRLLKESQHTYVISACLNILGVEAKEDARRLLKECEDPFVTSACLKILGDEAKEDARKLIKRNNDPGVLSSCLKILGDEAKEDARNLLKKIKNPYVISACLKVLGDKAKEDARKLIKKNDDPGVLSACLKILGDEAKEDARRLIKSSKDEWLLMACIHILGKEADDVTLRLAWNARDKSIRKTCWKLLEQLYPELRT